MKKYIIILVMCIILSITGAIIAEELIEQSELLEGKNLINLSYDFEPIYASDLIKIYPEINAITYTDEYGKNYGYVNVFGGIGEDFVISGYKTYEITTKQKFKLNLK